MKRRLNVWAACLLGGAWSCSGLAALMPGQTVVLQCLHKVTGRTISINAEVGVPVFFEKLSIVPRACYKSAPEDSPEASAFLDITEQKSEEGKRAVFNGWMFASSPAICPLEHPVYDVWVTDCLQEPSTPPAAPFDHPLS